jgi:cytochrome b561
MTAETITIERYSTVARWLHWTMGLLIVGNLAGGLLHDFNAELIMPLHKATGIGLLVLTMVRILWRTVKPAPPWPADMVMWEGALASFTHGILYAFMLLIPLSGWVMSSAGRWPISFFGLFDVPKFAVTRDDAIVGISAQAHEYMGYALIALLILHIGAALRHHFVLKDGILHRMWA